MINYDLRSLLPISQSETEDLFLKSLIEINQLRLKTTNPGLHNAISQE